MQTASPDTAAERTRADAMSHRFVDTFENVYNAPSLQVPWYFNAGVSRRRAGGETAGAS